MKRKKSTTKKGGESKRTKKKHTIAVVNPSREQRGILGVLNKANLSPNMQQRAKSAKLIVTGASEDRQSPTPSEILDDRIDIPEHQMRNMKLFSYKPFTGRPMLSPVQDKSSMENSQIDLKEASPAKSKGGYLRTPMFNIRGLLSPGRSKAKDSSPGKEGDKKAIDAISGLAAMTTVTAITSIAGEGKQASDGKQAADSKTAADSKPPDDPPKRRRFNLAKAIIDYGKKSDEEEKKKEEPKETVEEQPKVKPEVKRDGRRKDSEGNRVKDGNKKVKGKSKKAKTNDYDDYYEEEKPKKGMIKSALNLASNLAGKGNSSKKSSNKTVRSDRAGSGRQDRKSARVASGRVGATVKSGKASERASRVTEKSARASGKPTPKSATGPKGKTLRRSSSASALNVDSVKKMNRLYEKNVKAAHDRNGKTLKGDKKSRQSTDSLLTKSDSKGELKQKTGSKSASTKAIEKRDSEKSLKMKKSDSNKSLSKLAKKSDSKGSLFGKRSDSKSSLHQIDSAMVPDSPVNSVAGMSIADVGKNVLNTVNEVPGDNAVKSTRVTPRKLQSKGSLLSLLSFKSVSHRNVADPEKVTTVEGGRADSRPGTATATRLKSASVRNMHEKPGTPVHNDSEIGSRTSIREKPGSTKLIRKDLSRTNSRISMKSVAHARSFISMRPSSNEENGLKKNESMPQMSKVKEGSQEHDDVDSIGEKGKTMMTPSATHVMTVAGDGEGMKVANEYTEQRATIAHSPEMDLKGNNPNMRENQPSANTDMMPKNHRWVCRNLNLHLICPDVEFFETFDIYSDYNMDEIYRNLRILG